MCRTQSTSPPRGATTSRCGPASSGSGTVGPSRRRRLTLGSGFEDTPNALPGVSEARCWAKLGAGVDSPVTLPSQVNACSRASSSGSSEASIPVEGMCCAATEASEASAVAASGGRAVPWIASRCVSSIERTIASRPTASRPTQSGAIATTLPAACEAGRHRLDEHADLLLAGRIDERVDAALGVEQALRPEAEHEQHRRSLAAPDMVRRAPGTRSPYVPARRGPSRITGWMPPWG